MERLSTRNAGDGAARLPASQAFGGPAPDGGAGPAESPGSLGRPGRSGRADGAEPADGFHRPEPSGPTEPSEPTEPPRSPGPPGTAVLPQRPAPLGEPVHERRAPECPDEADPPPSAPCPAGTRGDGLPAYAPGAGRRAQVRRVSVRGQVLDALRTALVQGELVPGEVYSAPALGERFGVSATPVREAMQQLACEGAVEVVPNRGFRVTCPSARELAELAEVRALIEVPVVLRLAGAGPAGRWDFLRPLADAAAAVAGCGDRAGYVDSDRAFHRALLGAAGNQQLVRTVDELHRRAQWPLAGPPVMWRRDLPAHAAQHTALLDALTARDLPAVESLVREHYASTGTYG